MKLLRPRTLYALVALAVLALPRPASAAGITLAQNWTTAAIPGASTTSQSVTLPAASHTGNLIVVIYRNEFTSAGSVLTDLSVTDDAGNTYTNAAFNNGSSGSNQFSCGIWFAYNITGSASPQVTFHSVQTGFFGIDVAEFSGELVSSTPVDGNNSAFGSSTSFSSGAVTTSAWPSTGLLIAVESNNQSTNTITDGSGWTRIFNDGASTSDYQISAAGTYTGTWSATVNSGWEAAIAAFQPSAGGNTPMRTLLGVGGAAPPTELPPIHKF